jgi:hypothetical protein
MTNLRDVVQRYKALAGSFGTPVALAAFGLDPEETQTAFCMFDEDYQISRFFHFSCEKGQSYAINGELVTHVAIDAGINSAL